MSQKTEVYAPLEQHLFVGLPNDFKCVQCGKGRSQHEHDGFVANAEKPKCSMGTAVRYSRHPYFYRPGTLNYVKEGLTKEQSPAKVSA